MKSLDGVYVISLLEIKIIKLSWDYDKELSHCIRPKSIPDSSNDF